MINLPCTTSKLLDNQYSIKKYNDDSYKLILYKTYQYPPGYEKDNKNKIPGSTENINTGKLENNISRTRSKIWEYAECNDFTYFITLTLDKKKKNRHDLDEYIKTLSQYIRNNRRLTGSNIQYLLIPEKHKDGAWHMHGLINGVNESDLELFTVNDHLPDRVRNLIKQGRLIYNWIPYNKKFGYVTVEKIQNKSWVAKYITKYIKKDLGTSVTELQKKTYFVSRGLNQSETIKKGTFPTELRNALRFKYENEYVGLIDLNHEQYLKLTNLL